MTEKNSKQCEYCHVFFDPGTKKNSDLRKYCSINCKLKAKVERETSRESFKERRRKYIRNYREKKKMERNTNEP